MDSKARRKGKGKGQTYIAFLYHACQALGVRITADGPFKVDIRNGDLERLERMKILDIFNDGLGRNAQSRLDNEKLELKEYTKEAVRYRDRLKIIEKITSKQFAHNGAHAEENRKGIRISSLSMHKYKIMIAAAFNVVPVKMVVTTWTRRGKIH